MRVDQAGTELFESRDGVCVAEKLVGVRPTVFAHRNGLAAAIHCGSPTYAADMAKRGFRLVTVGSDARFIEAGARQAVATFRDALA